MMHPLPSFRSRLSVMFLLILCASISCGKKTTPTAPPGPPAPAPEMTSTPTTSPSPLSTSTRTGTPSWTPTASHSPSPSGTSTTTRTPSPSPTPTTSPTVTGTATPTPSPTTPGSPTNTRTPSNTPTLTPTITHTPLPTDTPACTATLTFGVATIGTAGSVNGIRAVKAVLVENATILSLSLYNSLGSFGNVRVAVYDDDGTAGAPGTRLAESPSVYVTALGWNVIDLPDLPLAPGTYWLAFQAENSISAVSGSTGDTYYASQSFGPFPASMPYHPGNYLASRFSIFANYCLP